jgi:hypothetical protein
MRINRHRNQVLGWLCCNVLLAFQLTAQHPINQEKLIDESKLGYSLSGPAFFKRDSIVWRYPSKANSNMVNATILEIKNDSTASLIRFFGKESNTPNEDLNLGSNLNSIRLDFPRSKRKVRIELDNQRFRFDVRQMEKGEIWLRRGNRR